MSNGDFIIGLILVAMMVFAVISSKNKPHKRVKHVTNDFSGGSNITKSHSLRKSDKECKTEAEAIASKVKTLKGIETLEEKIENLHQKSMDYDYQDNDEMREKTEEKIKILELAMDLAYDMPFRYYFMGQVDADTPMELLPMVGKTITINKYEALDSGMQDYFDVITIGDCDGDIEEAKSIAAQDAEDDIHHAKELLKMYKLLTIEDESEKAKKFNNLVSKSPYLIELLDLDEDPIMEDYNNEFEASLYGQYLTNFE